MVVVVWVASVKPKSESVSLKVIGFGTNESEVYAVIQLTNAGPYSIEYLGYETNHPWFSYHFQTTAGPTNECIFGAEQVCNAAY